MRNESSYINEGNNCPIDDLLQDSSFIVSQLEPAPESDEFWEKKREEGIVSPEDYDFSRRFIRSVQVNPEFISDSDIFNLWINIEAANKNNIQRKKRHSHILSVISGSVAIFIFLLWLTTIISNKESNNTFTFFNAEKENETTTEVQLRLDGNKTLPLEGEEVKIAYNNDDIAINDNKIVLKNDLPANENHALHELVVPWGKRSLLTLSDGSRIWVNAGTRVAYPVTFDKKKREIFVDGEIYAEISHDKNRPFIVKTEKMDVEVLGTKFDVMAYKKDTVQNIILVSGSVKIHNNRQNKAIVLSPNEMYSFGNELSKIQKVDVEEYISWRTGIYQYNSESLGKIIECLSHYYGCSINCSSPQVSQMKFSGKLDLKDKLDMVLGGIAQTAPIAYRYDNGVYIITNK